MIIKKTYIINTINKLYLLCMFFLQISIKLSFLMNKNMNWFLTNKKNNFYIKGKKKYILYFNI